LAIGDGANDTDMIKGTHPCLYIRSDAHGSMRTLAFMTCLFCPAEAHIGVGIAGFSPIFVVTVDRDE
jgi:hypothetical protein